MKRFAERYLKPALEAIQAEVDAELKELLKSHTDEQLMAMVPFKLKCGVAITRLDLRWR